MKYTDLSQEWCFRTLRGDGPSVIPTPHSAPLNLRQLLTVSPPPGAPLPTLWPTAIPAMQAT